MSHKFPRPTPFTCHLTLVLALISLSMAAQAQSATRLAQSEASLGASTSPTPAAPEEAPAREAVTTSSTDPSRTVSEAPARQAVAAPEESSSGAPTPSETPAASDPPADPTVPQDVAPTDCRQTIKADVVALDQPFMWNRLGAAQPQGMVFALKRDVVPTSVGLDENGNDKVEDVNKAGCLARPGDLSCLDAGKVRLRSGKRARPMVLRLNAHDCLEITFKNLLAPAPTATSTVKTRNAGLHLQGLQLVSSTGPLGGPGINSDASFVGVNPNAPAGSPGAIGSYAAPDKTLVYKYYAVDEGAFLASSGAGDENGQLQAGLFGAVNVEPEGAEYYRSQVTRDDLQLATFTDDNLPNNDRVHMFLEPKLIDPRPGAARQQEKGAVGEAEERKVYDLFTLTTVHKLKQTVQTATVIKVPINVTMQIWKDGRLQPWSNGIKNYLYVWEPTNATSGSADLVGHPVIDYNALYPANYPIDSRRCKPILRMVDTIHPCDVDYIRPEDKPLGEKKDFILYHTDLTAIITGPNADRFPYTNVSPTFRNNPASPDRRQPYREFTIHYHNPSVPVQAFTQWASTSPDAQLRTAYGAVRDLFAINYGTGGIGAEIVSNRLGVGPAGGLDAVELKFEEFFLSAWAVGDPAMVVDIPANYSPPAPPAPPCNPNTLPPNGKCVPQITTNPPPGLKATKALYPDDPSNVYHSYMGDHTKFRILHAGVGANHVHHLHAHQWLHSPNNDNASYLDSQMINPGSAYTLEIVYNGSGNRNKTVGDSIFHCHFYPHFAQGMWSLWRVHDAFEAGTKLNFAGQPMTVRECLDANGAPVPCATPGAEPVWSRALPDAEIVRGTPIPALVPLPTLGMAPIPAKVRLTVTNDPDPNMRIPDEVWTKLKTLWGAGLAHIPDQWLAGRRVVVKTSSTSASPFFTRNPGFPFFIPGIAGHRPPHPPMDFGWVESEPGKPAPNPDGGGKIYLDGGLPRHIVLDGRIFREFHTRWDFTKDFVLYGKDKERTKENNYGLIDGALIAFQLPENGTAIEQRAMRTHAQRTHTTVLPDGDPGNFILNGMPPAPGAPYADPSVDDFGNSTINTRRYKAAALQVDTVFNKKGWHYPQQRMLTLINDAADVYRGVKPPEPFFFRSNTGETIEFWHTNLVPNYYEMDDFQVRTPTDIIGQHIHLVKFDVTASDGAANGWNYEDGTFSSEEVRERIFAINQQSGLFQFNPQTQFIGSQQKRLTTKTFSESYPANVPTGFTPPPEWDGAQTTIQRFDTDPLLNNEGVDRTLRTVFTHDHYGPSTHQQAGLYGGMLIEPEGSKWFDATTGKQLYDTVSKRSDGKPLRDDGGPTTWQAVIQTANESESYREFALEFQDMQLAYTPTSTSTPAVPTAQLFSVTGASVAQLVTELGACTGTAPAPGSCAAAPTTCTIKPITNCTTNPNVACAFLQSGVTLSSNAYAIATSTGASPTWAVIDPLPQTSPPQATPMCDQYGITSSGSGAGQQLAVTNPTMHPGWSDPGNAIGPPTARNVTVPSPTVISVASNGTYSLNYRSEPLPLRVATTVSNASQATDLGFVFNSMPRGDASLNTQPGVFNPVQPSTDCTTPDPKNPKCFQPINPTCTGPDCFNFPLLQLNPTCPPGTGSSASSAAASGCSQGTDPYTPLLRAYAGDRVQIRTLVGAHLVGHPLRLHGLRWRPEPSIPDSGFVGAQGMGLSEHFEMIFDVPRLPPPTGMQNTFADYLYEPSGGADGLSNGLWGIFRAYTQKIENLKELPTNLLPNTSAVANVSCPASARPRTFNVSAVSAATALPGGQLVYNSRGQAFTAGAGGSKGFDPTFPLADPKALLYVRSEDLNSDGTLKAGVPIEPLILRANAGECIKVVLTNCLGSSPTPCTSTTPQTLVSYPAGTFLNSPFGKRGTGLASVNPTLTASSSVGLTPQLLTHNITASGGTNIGFNPTQTAAPGSSVTYQWYAGAISAAGTPTPVEFGSINLLPADPLMQDITGMVGAIIVEPEGATVVEDAATRASAMVMNPDGTSFREMVLVFQNNIQAQTIPLLGGFNYRAELFGYRYPVSGQPTSNNIGQGAPANGDFTAKMSNTLISGLSPTTFSDPQTPVFSAAAGSPTRIRLLFGGGYFQLEVFDLHGHSWQEQPFIHDSTGIGHNRLSQSYGGYLMWPFQASNILLPSAGGRRGTTGDYLYSTFNTVNNNGTWGIFRVSDEVLLIQKAVVDGGNNVTVAGADLMKRGATTARPTVTVYSVSSTGTATPLGAAVPVNADGTWSFTVNSTAVTPGTSIIAFSSNSPAACTPAGMQNPFNRCITGRAQVQSAGTAAGGGSQER